MKRSIYILCGVLILLASCEKKVEYAAPGQPVYLSAVLPGPHGTKVPFEGTAPSESNPLNVAVWASTTENQFTHTDGADGSNGTVAIHTEASFLSSGRQLLSGAMYPSPQVQGGEAPAVYFVAMHPQDSWTTNDVGTQATYTFNGSQDVMFASRVSGAYDADGQDATNVLQLKFEHLLTRITIQMGVELKEGDKVTDVLDVWGRIMHLEIQESDKNIRNGVSIDLSEGDTFNYNNHVGFSGNAESLLFYKLGTDEVFPGESWYELTETIDSVAYVMCPPVTLGDGAEYLINFETVNEGDQSLKLDLGEKASSQEGTVSTRGCHYLVTLKFKRGRAITPEVEVIEWENGGNGTEYIED